MGPVAEVHKQALAAGQGKDIWIMGGADLAGQFADAQLLENVWVQYAPVTLGAGEPLLPRNLQLDLIELAHNRDFACTHFKVRHAPEPSTSSGTLDTSCWIMPQTGASKPKLVRKCSLFEI
ncbi:dihydrofolate reductase family protein [Jonesiaceae bacterium BS-20]|uniref:Dihydrofolate reductase family protein n=1 Tax=Jonesiaceae bacterium BS-20 TaxID=3120821 RepID=A0AAU7DYK3_9MICO